MAENSRTEAVEMLRRFVRGEASADELRVITRRLDLTCVGDICESLSFSQRDFHRIDIKLPRLARQLGLYLRGELEKKSLFVWVNQLHRIVTSRIYEASEACTQAISNTLRILCLLLDPDHTAPAHKLRASLLQINGWLKTDTPIPLRTFLPAVFRDMAPLHFQVLKNPIAFSWNLRDQWQDVGIIKPNEESVRLIPFSIFTQNFFRNELPALIARITDADTVEWARGDSFYYHPENNQAISLKESHPSLRNHPLSFQYFIDENGLAEIILDTRVIRREEVLFASKLFCLQNKVSQANLNGRRVSLAAR